MGSFTLAYQDTLQDFDTISALFDIQAMLPMKNSERISHVAPNPFRESTTISIDVPRTFDANSVNDGPGGGIKRLVPTEIKINVYDVKGRRVKTVYDGRLFSRIESFTWDGTNDRNVRVPSGIYFIKATAGSIDEVRKVVIVR